MKILAAKKILKANDALAEENRAALNTAGVFCVNLVGSPGCGKTTFIEAVFGHLKGRLSTAVIEGDIAGSIDAERLDALGVPVDNRAFAGALTGEHQIPYPFPLGPPLPITNYVNFGYSDLFPPDTAPLPSSLLQQVAGLLAEHPEGLNPDALYVVWAGANDFFIGLENCCSGPTN